jgi:hypothetical protein
MVGLAILIIGNLTWPHVWLWSVLGTCFYAFGIGLIFPTLFRFTLFSKRGRVGSFTQRATDRLAIITALKTGTWLQANSLVVSPPASIKMTGDTATQLIRGISMGLLAWLGLLFNMPETVRRGDVPFSPLGVVRDFRDVFRNRIFLLGAATLALSYIPLMSWVAASRR